ncbi:MAG: pilin [Patescibacteria group bacterium]
MQKIILSFLFVCLVLGAITFVFAEERPLEIDYPNAPGAVTPSSVEGTNLPDYVKYIFNFAIGVATLLALGVIIIGGVRHAASAGNPTTISDANGQIISGLTGLGILLASWMILTTINPQLVVFKQLELGEISSRPGPGVWLCNSPVTELENLSNGTGNQEILNGISTSTCFIANAAGDFPRYFNDKIKNIYLINSEATKYGAVLFADVGQSGECQVRTSSGSVVSKLSSVVPFIIKSDPQGDGVTLYEQTDFNTDVQGSVKPTSGSFGVGTHGSIGAKPVRSLGISLVNNVQTQQKQYIVVVSDKTPAFDGTKRCETFEASDHDLLDNYRVGSFCGWFWDRYPCIDSLYIIGGSVMGNLR